MRAGANGRRSGPSHRVCCHSRQEDGVERNTLKPQLCHTIEGRGQGTPFAFAEKYYIIMQWLKSTPVTVGLAIVSITIRYGSPGFTSDSILRIQHYDE